MLRKIQETHSLLFPKDGGSNGSTITNLKTSKVDILKVDNQKTANLGIHFQTQSLKKFTFCITFIKQKLEVETRTHIHDTIRLWTGVRLATDLFKNDK